MLPPEQRPSRWLPLLVGITAAILALPYGSAFQSGISFSGNLERVGERSISVQLADRSVVDAMLPDRPEFKPAAIAGQYRMGDQVEINCNEIPQVWEEATSRYQSLEVVTMRLVKRPSPEEIASMLEARSREGKNLLKRPQANSAAPTQVVDLNAPGGKQWEHARKINLDYVAKMPNFVADETAKRYRSGFRSGRFQRYDTIESEITFRGRNAVRRQIRRNGKPWDQPFDALPGYKWYEGFETEIGPLFDPQCPTRVEYQGPSRSGGRKMIEYRFTSPVDGCFPYFYFTYRRYNPAREGRVLLDDPGGNVMQVDDEATGFPTNFEFASREEHVFWDYVKIGETSHLLPVRANFQVLYSSGTRYRVEVEYKNHRHFESSTSVTFQ